MSTALRVAAVPPDRTDAELVEAVRQGDDVAFAELYSRYCHRIGSYVRGMVGDHGRAEDVTQEIFIAALRRMRDTAQPIAFKAWIYEIAKNACIDSFRRARRAQEVSLDADDDLSSADRGRLTAVTSIDSAIANKQAIDDLRGAFGGLSDSHHEILVMRELEGRSYTDIGERLGMSRPVVESTLFRARRRLAEEYDELTSGRRCEFVRKMVDSGPQFSLGIRDRRRVARHLAHCQSCRAHARRAGFDESSLGMPSVGAKIAALLPIPLLRAHWGGLEHDVVVGLPRARPSILAVRSIHEIARSSEQIAGAGAGAGRAGAAAAALVLASAAGGVATVTDSQPGKPLGRAVLHATASRPRASASHGLIGIVAGRAVHVTSSIVRSNPAATGRMAAGPRAGAPRSSRAAVDHGSVGGAGATASGGATPSTGAGAHGSPGLFDPVTSPAVTGPAGTVTPGTSGDRTGGAGGSPGASSGRPAGTSTGTSAGDGPTGTSTSGSPSGVPQPPAPTTLATDVTSTIATLAGAAGAAVPPLTTNSGTNGLPAVSGG